MKLNLTPISMAVAVAGFLILCGIGIGIGSAQLAAAVDWTQYRNERYGFRLQYPADVFAVEHKAEAGDGQIFVAGEGDARLLVGALANESVYTPATYQEYVARHSYGEYKIGYRRLASSWFVLSGEGDGKIFYEKVMFSCRGRLINSFAMIYPKAQRHIFDPIVERIEDTFRPGGDCERAGLSSAPLIPPRRVEKDQLSAPADSVARARGEDVVTRPRRRVERGQRSALADSIARARGQDVIVVLRRTTPPYDRKIMRGYTSRP